MGCLSGCLVSFASIQKLFCGICSVFKWSFDEFVGEKVVSPSYSSAILGPPPYRQTLYHQSHQVCLFNSSKPLIKFSTHTNVFCDCCFYDCCFFFLVQFYENEGKKNKFYTKNDVNRTRKMWEYYLHWANLVHQLEMIPSNLHSLPLNSYKLTNILSFKKTTFH